MSIFVEKFLLTNGKKQSKIEKTNGGEKNKKYLGRFSLDQVEEAFLTYKRFKENYIKQVADEYKNLIPDKVYQALYNYKVEITD